MSRADGSPEASIEEILASIRKTFSEDPAAPASSLQSADSEPRAFGLPPFRSAAEVSARASSGTPLPTPPRSRAAAIDEDLDGLIDKPSPTGSVPKESAAAVSPVEAAREKWANLLNPASANGAAAKMEAPAPKPEPVTARATPPSSAPVASSPSTGLFAPRKGGFYPPSEPRSEPTLPLPPSPAAPSPANEPSVAKAPEPAAQAPRPGFIPYTPPPASVSAPVQPAFKAETAPEPQPVLPSEPPRAAADLPAASARALDDLVAGLNNVAQASVDSPAADPVAAPASAPPSPALEPAFSVLEPPASKVTPPVAPAAPAPSPVSPLSASPAAAASGRTLEDAVADMLRPLLEKWIDENMPRIVERALQRDATLGRKP